MRESILPRTLAALSLIALLASAPKLSAQLDWVELGKEWHEAWSKGRIDLSAPRPTKTAMQLPGNDPALIELTKARGDKFFWCAEQELSFVLGGLAASMKDEALDVLFAFARSQAGSNPKREWTARKAADKQPWLVRDSALDTLRALQSPQVAERARALMSEAKGRDRPFDLAIALHILGARGALQDVDRIQPLLRDEEPELRIAAAAALGELAFPEAAALLFVELMREQDPLVRPWLLRQLVLAVARTANPEEELEGEFATTISRLTKALGNPGVSLTEQRILCELLWELRPLAALPELPGALARLQDPGEEQLRDLVHALLVDMHGVGHGLRERRGKRGTGFDAGPTDAEAWKGFIQGRRKLYVQKRAKRRPLPPAPEGTPELFGMPIQYGPVTLLLDASGAWSGPWWRQQKSGADGTPDGEESTTLGAKIRAGILEALGKLPEGTEFLRHHDRSPAQELSAPRLRQDQRQGAQAPGRASSPSCRAKVYPRPPKRSSNSTACRTACPSPWPEPQSSCPRSTGSSARHPKTARARPSRQSLAGCGPRAAPCRSRCTSPTSRIDAANPAIRPTTRWRSNTARAIASASSPKRCSAATTGRASPATKRNDESILFGQDRPSPTRPLEERTPRRRCAGALSLPRRRDAHPLRAGPRQQLAALWHAPPHSCAHGLSGPDL
jgi:hypothetical protein